MNKIIIILRHGKTNLSDELTQEGIDLAHKVGGEIRDLYPEKTFEVWSSDEERAIDTAKYIGQHLNVSKVSQSYNFGPSYVELSVVPKFITNSKSEYIIIITHEPFFYDLAQKLNMRRLSINHCEGVIINEDGSHFEYFKTKN